MLPSHLQRWPAPAKLNLFLHITGRREDGYHELQTVFQLLDYCDELAFDITDDGSIVRATALKDVPAESDITVQAAALLQRECGVTAGVTIYLHKRLPMGGGVGGGSSDAATTLVALNKLWDCGLDEDALAEMGRQIGADVPVFVRGKTAWGEGVGERLEPLELTKQYFLVIKPAVHVSTAELFSDSRLTRDCDAITLRAFLKGTATENVFENVVRARHKAIDETIEWLSKFAPARLTGTGACVFAAFPTKVEADRVLQQVPDEFSAFVAEGVNTSPLQMLRSSTYCK